MKVSKLTPALDKGMTTNTRENIEGFAKDSLNVLFSEADGAQTRPGSKQIPAGEGFKKYTIIPTKGGVDTVPAEDDKYLYEEQAHTLNTNLPVRESSGYSPSEGGIILPPNIRTWTTEANATPSTEPYFDGSVARIPITGTQDMTAVTISHTTHGAGARIGHRGKKNPPYSGYNRNTRVIDVRDVMDWYTAPTRSPNWGIIANRDVYTGHVFQVYPSIPHQKIKKRGSVRYTYHYFSSTPYIRLIGLKINGELVAQNKIEFKPEGEASVHDAIARFFYCLPQYLNVRQCSHKLPQGMTGSSSWQNNTLILTFTNTTPAPSNEKRKTYNITFDAAVAGMDFVIAGRQVQSLTTTDHVAGNIFGISPPPGPNITYSSTAQVTLAMPDEHILTVQGSYRNDNATPGLNTPNWVAIPTPNAPFNLTKINGLVERSIDEDTTDVSDADWELARPVSGDATTNPHPLFKDQEIYSIGNIGGRMYVVSPKGIEFSQLGNIKNFYRQDIAVFLADDPFRIPLTLSNKCTVIQYEGSILIRDGKRVYRILTSGAWVAQNVKLLEVDITPISNLVVVADRVMFLQATPSGVRLKSISTGVRAEQVKVTDHSKFYIIDPLGGGQEYILGRRSDDSVWLYQPGDETVQVYAHVTSIDRRNWDVWTRFKLASSGLVISPDNGDTVLTSTGVQSIRSVKGSSLELYTLDSLKDVTITTPTFIADAKNTHGFGESPLDPVYVKRDNGVPYSGLSTVLPQGTYTVGIPYSASMTLPELGFHDRYNRVDTANSGFIRKLRFKFKAARGVEVRHSEINYDDISYELTPLGSSFGHLSVDAVDGLYDNLDAEIGVHSKVGLTDVTLSNISGLGFHLNEIELTGQFVVRTNRTT